MKYAHDVILRPVISEKSMDLARNQKSYTFRVDPHASKPEIKKAVETVFGVKVAAVNTMHVLGKFKRMGNRPEGKTPAWKKAIVTLTEGSKTIEFFDGMM